MRLLLITVLLSLGLFASKLEVTTSIVPQQYFIQQIGGDKVQVNVMVKPGFSPATYEPKTSQMRKLAQSKAYFSMGVPFERVWLEKFQNANKKMMMVDTSKNIKKLMMAKHEHHDDEDKHEEHHEHEGHEHEAHHDHDEHEKHDSHEKEHEHEEKGHNHEGGLDPHIWLDPILVKTQAKNIYDALVSLDSKNKAFYTKNYEQFLVKLDKLNVTIQSILQGNKHATFMVFHPSWGYFAKRYDLEQIAVEKEGKEPKPKEIIELTKEAKLHNIKVVFVSPQFSQKSAKAIAKSIKGNVATIDPLSYKYEENLIKTAKAIKQSYQ
jgi:zinc transport system substrate-binding protein